MSNRARLDWVATPVRDTLDPSVLGSTEVDHYSIPALDAIGGPLRQPANEIESGKQQLSGGEVLVSRLNPRKARVVLIGALSNERPALCSGEFIVLRPHGIDGHFLEYVLKSESTRQFLDGAVQSVTRSHQRVRPEVLTKMWINVPPPVEQRAIADYLDQETARIDALITKKRRMIDLLQQRLTGEVEHLVLGLDVGGCPARSDFFDSVPSGWSETVLRHLGCRVQTGPFGSQLHAEEYVEDGWPVVNPSNLVGGRIVALPEMTLSDAKRVELARHTLRPGDIVFGRRGEMGRAGLVESRHEGWVCGTGSLRLRIEQSSLEPNYLKKLLETKALRRYFELSSVGSTMDNLNSEIVLGLPCLVPPRSSQIRIVSQVDRLRSAHDQLAYAHHRQLDLLAERRQALITAAVTGELEVPD